MTALTLYGLETASSTLATACKLVTGTGGTSANLTTKVGTVQGSGELFSLGSTATFPGTSVSSTAGVHGFLWDVTTLEGNNLLSGTYTVKFNLNWNATYTTMTSTITARVWKRSSGGVSTKIGSDMTVAGPGASTTAQTLFTLTGSSFPSMAFATGDKLYLDVWLTVTSTGGATTRTIALWASSSSTAGIAGQVEIDTPGYLPSKNTDSTGVRTLVRTQVTKSASLRTVMTRGPQLTVTKASDTFTRANQSGWGTASDTETWSTITGTPTLSIASNEGVLTGTGGNDVYMKLGSGTAGQQQGLVRFAMTKTTAPYAGVMLRFTDGQNWYRAYSDTSSLIIDKLVANAYTSLGSVAKPLVSGTFYWLRFDASGTTLRARLWQDGTTEPNTWDLTFTDTSLTSGGAGLFGKTNTGDQVQFDSFTMTTAANVMTTGLRAIVRGITKVASLRMPVRTQVTKSVGGPRTIVRTQVAKSLGLRVLVTATNLATKVAVLRTLVRSQKTASTGVRTLTRTQVTKSAALRVRAMTQRTLSSGVRTVVRGITKLAGIRARVRSQVTLSSQLRTPIRVLATRSSALRTLARSARSLSSSLRTNVRTQVARSSVLRAIVRGITKIASLRILVRVQRALSTSLRMPIRSLRTLSSGLRAVIRTQATRSSVLRAVVGTLHSVSAAIRTRVRSLRTRSTVLRVVTTFTGTLVTKSSVVRLVARTLHSLSVGMRTRIRSQVTRSTMLRAIVRGMTRVASVRIVARGRSLLVGTRIPVRTVRSLSSQVRAVVRSRASRTLTLRAWVGTLATRSAVLRLVLRGLTRVTRMRIRVRSQRSVVTALRARAATVHVLNLFLLIPVRSVHTPTASLRVLVYVLPPVPNATLLMREGEADMTMREGGANMSMRGGQADMLMRSGEVTFYIRSGEATIEVREQ